MKYHTLNFLKIYAFIVAVLFTVYLIKGYMLSNAITDALMWGLLTASIVKITRVIRARKGQQCELCD